MMMADPLRSKIPSIGNQTDPKLIIVLTSPEPEDDTSGNLLSGPKGMLIRQCLDDNLADVYITCLVKQCLYNDPITRIGGSRKPTPEEVKVWLPRLKSELEMFPDVRIMLMGATLMEVFFSDVKPIKEEVGKVRELKLNEATRIVIPNFDPFYVMSQQRILPEFKQIVEGGVSGKIFNPFGSVATEANLHEFYKVCSFDEAVVKLQECLQLYQEKKITEIIFDTETSSLVPWGGHIIMYSWCHSMDPIGYAVPLQVNNTIAHENLPYEIPLYPHTITEQQKEKLLHLAGKIISTIPIVGHNLKFDVKFCVWHQLAKLENIVIKDDTMLMASQIYGGGHLASMSGGLGLKDLCRRMVGAPNWDFALHDYLGRFKRVVQRSFDNLPTGMLGKYAALDSYWNLKLYQHLKTVIRPEVYGILNTFNKAITVFAEAELKGIQVDNTVYEFLKNAYEHRLVELEALICDLPTVKKLIALKMSGLLEENSKKRKPKSVEELRPLAFKLRSGDYLGVLIYDKEYYGMPVENKHKTEGGKAGTSKDAIEFLLTTYLTDEAIEKTKQSMVLTEEHMEELLEKRAFLTYLTEYLRFAKTLIPRYIDPVAEETIEGLYKPDYNLIGAGTGRMCLVGETKISLLNGEEKEIKDFEVGENLSIYGCSTTGAVVPVRGRALGVTKHVTELVEVTLDNDEVIKCTPDHRFMLRDGSYKEAQYLVDGESLMPLYRTINKDGYEEFKSNDTEKYHKTHRIVALHLTGGIQECWDRVRGEEKRIVVHHINFKKLDNSPENLKWMGWLEHHRYHRKTRSPEQCKASSSRLKGRWHNPKTRPALIEMIGRNSKKRWLTDPVYRETMRTKRNPVNFGTNPELHKRAVELSIPRIREAFEILKADATWVKAFSEKKLAQWDRQRRLGMVEEIGNKISIGLDDYFKNRESSEKKNERIKKVLQSQKNPEYYVKQRLGRIYTVIVTLEKYLGPIDFEKYSENVSQFKRDKLIPGNSILAKDEKEFLKSKTYNHRVKSVKPISLDKPIPVYDIEVPETSNFALTAGVFVHNSSGFHTLPNKCDVKRMYTSRWAGKGGLFAAPDASQLEIRIVASLAKENGFIDAYKKGFDVHQNTASLIYKKPFELVTGEERGNGKCVRGDTLVETNRGPIPIQEIVGDVEDDSIIPYTGNLQILTLDGYQPIESVYKLTECRILEIEDEDGNIIRCTPNHPFVTQLNSNNTFELTKASDLEIGQDVYTLVQI